MSLQEINNRMIEIEERINSEEHNLSLPFGNRLDRENNRSEDIILRLERLENEWDRLAESIHN
jgi:hypothetical protein